MRFSWLLLALVIGAGLPGCDTSVPTQQPIDLPEKTPLTVDQWKKLPISEKYDPSSFERLKLNDPALKAGAAWDQFMRGVVAPERQQDIPR